MHRSRVRVAGTTQLAAIIICLATVLSGCVQPGGGYGGGYGSSSADQAGEFGAGSEQGPPLSQADEALARGDLQAAGDAYRSAMRTSKDPKAMIGLAETRLASGDLREADRLFLMADRIGDHSAPRSQQGQGLIALRRGQLSASVNRLKQAVDGDPGLWRSWIGLARAYLQQGDLTASASALSQAEHHAPGNPSMLNDLGVFHLSRQDTAQAKSYFEKAQLAGLDHDYVRANIRIATAMAGQYEAAIAGVTQDALPDALNNAGYAAILNGDLEMADTLLRRAVEISPVYHVAAMANLDLLNQVSTTRNAPTQRSNGPPGPQGPARGVPSAGASSPGPTPEVPQASDPREATSAQTFQMF